MRHLTLKPEGWQAVATGKSIHFPPTSPVLAAREDKNTNAVSSSVDARCFTVLYCGLGSPVWLPKVICFACDVSGAAMRF
jgi:hypothetical protein